MEVMKEVILTRSGKKKIGAGRVTFPLKAGGLDSLRFSEIHVLDIVGYRFLYLFDDC